MTLQEEQEAFQKQIQQHFISLFDLTNKIVEEKSLDMNQAGLFLLTRINLYLEKEDKRICCELVEPPFEKYSLDYVPNINVLDALRFLSKNGRFRSENNAKKYGILLSEINAALSNSTDLQPVTQTTPKNYHPSERETHLQMIAILAEELAKRQKSKFLKASGLPNNLALAELINMRAKEIEIESVKTKSVDTYRRRLTEISSFYKGE